MDLKYFIIRTESLHLYRAFLRLVRAAPEHARGEFVCIGRALSQPARSLSPSLPAPHAPVARASCAMGAARAPARLCIVWY
jgi:hypothetical protein